MIPATFKGGTAVSNILPLGTLSSLTVPAELAPRHCHPVSTVPAT